jgi:formylglycine-generating enzyme required for sulfatase activity
MKTHLQAIKIVLCVLTLGASLAVQATLPSPNSGMVSVPKGWFLRGDAIDNESDAHTNQVFVSTFQMDTNLITYSNWQLVYQYATNSGYSFTNAGSRFGPNDPVQTVSWYDAVKWCNARSQMEGKTPCYYTDTNLTMVYTSGIVSLTTNNVNWTANGYRLPTEAEWEKAARGGLTTNRFPWGMNISQSMARYQSPMVLPAPYDLGPANSIPTSTSPVGTFHTNGYGLYDMAGNVSEWCWDFYSATYYSSTTTNNPHGPASGSTRVARGGNWNTAAFACCCAARSVFAPSLAKNVLGFRCVQIDNKQTPVASTPVSSGTIIYGQTLDSATSTLSGTFTNATGALVDGTLAFALPNLVPNAGNTNVLVIFTPTDTTDYDTITTSVSVTVNKATPTITTAPTASAITYGQTLASSTLSGGGGSVPGSFAFTTPSTAPNVGTALQSLTFTPTDTTDYNTITTNVSVTVNKATPTITTAPTASAITYGQTLASSSLSGGVGSVSGNFAFTTPSTAPNAGTASQSVRFTPTDTNNFNSVTTTVTVTVTPANLSITASAQSKTYGQAVTFSSGSTNFTSSGLQPGDTIGSVTLACSGGAASKAVSGSPYTITPSAATGGGSFNANNYSITYNPGYLTVTPENLTITANSQSKQYGQIVTFGIGSTQFTSSGLQNNDTIGSVTLACSGGAATAAVSGSPYTITPSAAIGGGSFNVNNYSITYNSGYLTVTPKALTVTANDASRSYGATNPVFTASYFGFVNPDTTNVLSGSPYLWSPATNYFAPGIYPNIIIATQGSLSATNYSFNFVNGTLTITNLNGIVDPAALQAFLGNGIVDQAGLNVVLANYWASSPPYIANFDISAKTNFTFIMTNFNFFTVQFSTNLVNTNWQDLGQVVFQFTDTNAAIRQMGFYRIVASTNSF